MRGSRLLALLGSIGVQLFPALQVRQYRKQRMYTGVLGAFGQLRAPNLIAKGDWDPVEQRVAGTVAAVARARGKE